MLCAGIVPVDNPLDMFCFKNNVFVFKIITTIIDLSRPMASRGGPHSVIGSRFGCIFMGRKLESQLGHIILVEIDLKNHFHGHSSLFAEQLSVIC